ncbi:MAG TPA: hypothetical protein PLX33_08300 [Alphaproteobacteria bacterium]|nr:hypothetical protein [Alphaproteobacteria bacterium]
MTGFADIKRAIIAALTPELLSAQYRAGLQPGDPVETGHCAVASEAFYHIAGGKAAGFMPVVCGYTVTADGKMHFGAARVKAERETKVDFVRETHWWIRGPKDGKRGAGAVFDVTAAQYDAPFPYENGHNTGFMQPQQKPSKRAQVVIDRVAKSLGAETLAAYRRMNIAAFQKKLKTPAPRR